MSRIRLPFALNHIAQKLIKIKNNPAINKLIDSVSVSTASDLIPLISDEIHPFSSVMIAEAKQEVCMQFYKFFGTSDGGKEIVRGLRELERKAKKLKPVKPIVVKILLNSRGTWAQKFYKENNETGLEKLAKELNSQYFQISLAYHPTDAFGTFHSKMIIIDGERALLRGGDPAEPNNYNHFQFETATFIQGPCVMELHADFQQSWSRMTGHPQLDSQSKSKPFANSALPCIFISKKENGNPLSIKYHNCESPYKIALLEGIISAKKSVKIMSPNLNDPDIARALVQACNRKVNVQIILGKYHNDIAEAFWGGTNFNTMTSIVNRIDFAHRQFLNIRWATNDKRQIVKHGERYTMHGKYACIDDAIVFVGSTPLDKQGIYFSRESDLIFEDQSQAKLFNKKFFNDQFLLGKDYFLDCFDTLIDELNKHIKQWLSAQDGHALQKRKKAALVRNALKNILSKVSNPDIADQDKPMILLQTVLPILEKTIIKYFPFKPKSYLAIQAIAKKYGLIKTLEKRELKISASFNNGYATLFSKLPQPQLPTSTLNDPLVSTDKGKLTNLRVR